MEGRFVQVGKPGGSLEVVTRGIQEPEAGHVRVKIQACGVCHSDALTIEGGFPGISYPRVPGHEVIGVVDVVGADVPQWKAGQRVGIGWFGGHCGRCEPCRRGDLIACQNLKIPGLTYDGGYADYITVPADALAAVPAALQSAEAAPLLCAGLTMFNALRNSGAKPPDTVAIQGLGGLGHLGVQFAAKMGFNTVVISRSDNSKLAHELGARHYIDSSREDVAAALQKLGGAKVVLATAPNNAAMADTIGGLGHAGKLVVLGVSSEPLPVSTIPMMVQKQSIQGWPNGTSIDSEDTLKFSNWSGVLPLIERYPLEKAADAYARMMSGKARFRVVLETDT